MSEPVKDPLTLWVHFTVTQEENLKKYILSCSGVECWGRSEGKSAGWVLKQVRNPLEDLSAQSVLVVRLLLARAGDAVLGLAGARAQAVQSPTILCIINVVFEEKLNKTKQIYVRWLLCYSNTPAILACCVFTSPTKWFNYFLDVMHFLSKQEVEVGHLTVRVVTQKYSTAAVSKKKTTSGYLCDCTSFILKKAMPVSSESDPAWCCRPILFSSSWSATSCSPPYTNIHKSDVSRLALTWFDRFHVICESEGQNNMDTQLQETMTLTTTNWYCFHKMTLSNSCIPVSSLQYL